MPERWALHIDNDAELARSERSFELARSFAICDGCVELSLEILIEADNFCALA